MISSQVRLLILNETDVEEQRFIHARLAALQAEMEQQLFFFNIATGYDEVPKFRNWIEKQDTTYGPLYARTFKRYQDEQNWRPNLLHPPFLQHHPIVPLYLRYTPPPRINFVGGTQNRPDIGNRLSDEGTIKNFNMPFIYNPPIMAPPDVLDSRLRMPLRLPELSADFELPLQLPSSSRIERTENK